MFLLWSVVFFVLFHVYIRVSYLALAWNLSLSVRWSMFVCERREYWLSICCSFHFLFVSLLHINFCLCVGYPAYVCLWVWLTICWDVLCVLLLLCRVLLLDVYFLFICVCNLAYVCLWEKGVLTPPPSNGRISSCPVNVHLHACYPSIQLFFIWQFLLFIWF